MDLQGQNGSPTEPAWRRWRGRMQQYFVDKAAEVQTNVKARWRVLVKELVAIVAVIIFMFSDNYYAMLPASALMVIGITGLSIDSPIGNVIRTIVQATIGGGVGVVLGGLCTLMPPGQALGRWAVLTVAVFLSIVMRSQFPRLFLLHVNFVIFSTFSTVTSYEAGFHGFPAMEPIAQAILMMLVGYAICFATSLLFFPRFATKMLWDGMHDEEMALHEMMLLCRGSLLNNEDNAAALAELSSASRNRLQTLRVLRYDASWEFSSSLWKAKSTDECLSALQRCARIVHSTATYVLAHPVTPDDDASTKQEAASASAAAHDGSSLGCKPADDAASVAWSVDRHHSEASLLPATSGIRLHSGANEQAATFDEAAFNELARAHHEGSPSDAASTKKGDAQGGDSPDAPIFSNKHAFMSTDTVNIPLQTLGIHSDKTDHSETARLLQDAGFDVDAAGLSSSLSSEVFLSDKDQRKIFMGTFGPRLRRQFATCASRFANIITDDSSDSTGALPLDELETIRKEFAATRFKDGLQAYSLHFILFNMAELASALDSLRDRRASLVLPVWRASSFRDTFFDFAHAFRVRHSTSPVSNNAGHSKYGVVGDDDADRAAADMESMGDVDEEGSPALSPELSRVESHPGMMSQLDVEWEEKDSASSSWVTRAWYSWSLSFGSSTARYALRTTLMYGVLLILILLIPSLTNQASLWALYTVAIVSSPTFGGNLAVSSARIVGTILGGLWAVATWKAAAYNWGGLVAMALPLLIIATYLKCTGSARLSAQVIIPFVIVVMLARQPPYQDVLIIALTRIAAISVGLVVVLVFSLIFWPYVASIEARKRMGNVVYDMGRLFGSIISRFAATWPIDEALDDADELLSAAQVDLAKTRELLVSVNSERHMITRTHTEAFYRVLSRLESVLDRLVSSLLLSRHGYQLGHVRSHLLAHARRERRELYALMSLHFYVLAAALRADEPLPCFVPSAQVALRKLLKKLASLPGASSKYSFAKLVPYLAFLSIVDEMTVELRSATFEIAGMVGVDRRLMLSDFAMHSNNASPV